MAPPLKGNKSTEKPVDMRGLSFLDRDGNFRQCGALVIVTFRFQQFSVNFDSSFSILKDKRFSLALLFVKYEKPLSDMQDKNELGRWLRNLKIYETNLRLLLRLPLHR